MARGGTVDPVTGYQINYCRVGGSDLAFKRIAGIVYGRFQTQPNFDSGWQLVPFTTNGGVGSIRGSGTTYGYWSLNGMPPAYLCKAYVP
jgi:hypothetical protein